jgi:crotonobetainyl-CoA:carnitine CoA-transferase CaiB-like acyl-CoA transferase
VIKVERPDGGDDTRAWGPPYDATGQATYFQAVNRNKESLVLDLRDADDAERARALADEADVVVENFRPGVMERLGLGYEQLSARGPSSSTARSPASAPAPGRRCPATTCSSRRSAG